MKTKADIADITMDTLRVIENEVGILENNVSCSISQIREYLYNKYGKRAINKYIKEYIEKNESIDGKKDMYCNHYDIIYMSDILLLALIVDEEINNYPIRYRYISKSEKPPYSEIFTSTEVKAKQLLKNYELEIKDINKFSMTLCSYNNKLSILISYSNNDNEDYQLLSCGNFISYGYDGKDHYGIIISQNPYFGLDYVYGED